MKKVCLKIMGLYLQIKYVQQKYVGRSIKSDSNHTIFSKSAIALITQCMEKSHLLFTNQDWDLGRERVWVVNVKHYYLKKEKKIQEEDELKTLKGYTR